MPETSSKPPGAEAAYQEQRRAYWESLAGRRPWRGLNAYYYRRLAEIYRFVIPPGRKVLELGCGQGDLLAAVEPAYGVGVDFSPAMLARAARKYPRLRFVEATAEAFGEFEKFDYIILSDLVNDLWDVQQTLEHLRRFCDPDTRVVFNLYSRLWELPRRMAEKLHLVTPMLPQNWLTVEDLENLLYLADFETVRRWHEILWPVRTPLVNAVANRAIVKLWPFRYAALANFVLARPRAARKPQPQTVSVIVPARNEEGNIENIFRLVPDMGAGTELILVEGGSRDDTYAAIERTMARYPNVRAKLLRQTGKGKGDAVRLGFAESAGDLLMILDADLTVPPEDLPRFYEALISGKAEFANGVRLVYPMEKGAMRFLNLLGNKFFSLAFSWLLGQSIKDTLCGTKALSRAHYERIAANRAYFGDFDPFGDFDLIFGAAKSNLKIADLPVRYRERVYGETNIQRWRHGLVLLRMVWFALRRIKFV